MPPHVSQIHPSLITQFVKWKSGQIWPVPIIMEMFIKENKSAFIGIIHVSCWTFKPLHLTGVPYKKGGVGRMWGFALIVHINFALHEKNQNFRLIRMHPFPQNLELGKFVPCGRFVPRNFLCKVSNRRDPGRGGGGERVSPSQNPLLVAALGQPIANSVWIFLTTFLIKTSYRYSLNSIYS